MFYTELKERFRQELLMSPIDNDTLIKAKSILVDILFKAYRMGYNIELKDLDNVKFAVDIDTINPANNETYNLIKLLQTNEICGVDENLIRR